MEHRFFYRRHLPHYQPERGTFHLVFRLAGSVPQSLLRSMREEISLAPPGVADISDETRAQLVLEHQRERFRRLEAVLDAASVGPRWLSQAGVAKIVSEAIHHRDGSVYGLLASCIMPNHVHMLIAPMLVAAGGDYGLARILHSLKGYTAWRSSQCLGRRGAFWQAESFDRAVRSREGLERTVAYIARNPVKAGLVDESEDWPWTYVARLEDT